MGIHSNKMSQLSTVDIYCNKISRSMDTRPQYSDAMITGRREAGIIIIRTMPTGLSGHDLTFEGQ